MPAPCADDMAPAGPYMMGLIAWTADALGKFLAQHVDKFGELPAGGIYAVAPLAIQDEKEDRLMSFKEPWKVEQCQKALSTTDMYEAAGNICWLQPIAATETEEILAGDPPSMADVNEAAENFFPLPHRKESTIGMASKCHASSSPRPSSCTPGGRQSI